MSQIQISSAFDDDAQRLVDELLLFGDERSIKIVQELLKSKKAVPEMGDIVDYLVSTNEDVFAELTQLFLDYKQAPCLCRDISYDCRSCDHSGDCFNHVYSEILYNDFGDSATEGSLVALVVEAAENTWDVAIEAKAESLSYYCDYISLFNCPSDEQAYELAKKNKDTIFTFNHAQQFMFPELLYEALDMGEGILMKYGDHAIITSEILLEQEKERKHWKKTILLGGK